LSAKRSIIAGAALGIAALGVGFGWRLYQGERAIVRAAQLERTLVDTRRMLRLRDTIDADDLLTDKANGEVRDAVEGLLRRPVADGDLVCIDAGVMRAIGDYK